MGASGEVQGDALIPRWDFDIIYFFLFTNLLNQEQFYKSKTKFPTVSVVLV
jgi:hypothetical protein